jgi:hypothetical protein
MSDTSTSAATDAPLAGAVAAAQGHQIYLMGADDAQTAAFWIRIRAWERRQRDMESSRRRQA